MFLFDQIFDAAETEESLSDYLRTHMADINDFYNSPYEVLKNEIDSVDRFILRKRRFLRSLPFDKMYSRSFLLILLDLCTSAENGAYPPTQNGLIHPQLLLKWP